MDRPQTKIKTTKHLWQRSSNQVPVLQEAILRNTSRTSYSRRSLYSKAGFSREMNHLSQNLTLIKIKIKIKIKITCSKIMILNRKKLNKMELQASEAITTINLMVHQRQFLRVRMLTDHPALSLSRKRTEIAAKLTIQFSIKSVSASFNSKVTLIATYSRVQQKMKKWSICPWLWTTHGSIKESIRIKAQVSLSWASLKGQI